MYPKRGKNFILKIKTFIREIKEDLNKWRNILLKEKKKPARMNQSKYV